MKLKINFKQTRVISAGDINSLNLLVSYNLFTKVHGPRSAIGRAPDS